MSPQSTFLTAHSIHVSREYGHHLLSIIHELSQDLPFQTRCQRVVDHLADMLHCDAAALLRYDGEVFLPVATHGLTAEVMGKRYIPSKHPRLNAILSQSAPLIFADDDPRPDPWDGQLKNDPEAQLTVHSCLAAPLIIKGKIEGAITLDSAKSELFSAMDPWLIDCIVGLAAAALRTARVIETLQRQALTQHRSTRDMVDESLTWSGQLIGESPVMKNLIEEVALVAHTDLSVLICGETGTGKEVVARTIHTHSARAEQALVYVNCAALPEQIAESELFGHIKGAFTGADRERSGKFELANHGTLLLDEVGDLPLSIQTKLLRALQFGEIQRVGEDHNISVDVRILAATNRDLQDEVKRGNFRADLYHRLNVYPVTVPPLRDRRDDIPLFAGFFLDQAAARLGNKELRLSESAMQKLMQYQWFGNVRELEHVMTRAALRAANESQQKLAVVNPEHLDIDYKSTESHTPFNTDIHPGESLADAIDRFQAHIIKNAVEHSDSNWAKAAKRLQVDRSNLHRLGKRLGLKDAQESVGFNAHIPIE